MRTLMKAISLTATLLFATCLFGCGSNKSFNELASYVIENGDLYTSDDHPDLIFHTCTLEPADSNELGEITVVAVTTDGTAATCDTISFAGCDGVAENAVGSDGPVAMTAFITISESTGQFTFAHYPDITANSAVDWYFETDPVEASSYSRSDSLPAYYYDLATEQRTASVDAEIIEQELIDMLTLFLVRVDSGLASIGFGVSDLGFSSFQ